MKLPLRGYPKKELLKSSQDLCRTLAKDELVFSKFSRWRPTTILKVNYFKDFLQEFCLDFKQRCNLFWSFWNTNFIESLSITVHDSSARILCNGLCNARIRGFVFVRMFCLIGLTTNIWDIALTKEIWELTDLFN